MIGLDWNIEQVVASLRRGTEYLSATANRNFSNPHDGIWGNGDKFVEYADLILTNLSVPQRRLFLSVCLASYLLNLDKAPTEAENWLRSNCDIHDLIGIDCTWEQIVSWKWGRVAIVVADTVDKNRGRIFYCLSACCESGEINSALPNWAPICMDKYACNAVETAAELANRKAPEMAFFLWPILDNSLYGINGKSLGLPTYLSFCTLASASKLLSPPHLATGELDHKGNLFEVCALEQKIKLGQDLKFSSFIYPLDANTAPLMTSGKPDAVGVKNLEEAERAWGLNSLENNFTAYLERVKNNFRTRISRFVHLKGQEEITLLNSFAVEHIEEINEDEGGVIARRGTIKDLRNKQVIERRMMLWGDAGMGKSTTLEYLAFKDADKKLKDSEMPLPVYLPLGLLTDKNMTVKQIIWKRIGVDESVGEAMLADGSLSLFLDGVNEIPRDINNFLINTRIREIQSLIDEHRNTFVMVSNRQQPENIFTNIPVFIMQRMDEKQIESFIHKNADDLTLATLIHTELAQNQRLARIVRTPLMLSRLIEVARDEGIIPKSEGEIIHRFIHCLYNREKIEKKDCNFEISKIHKLLRYLGYESLEELDTNAGMTEDHVLEYFVKCMRHYGFHIDTMYVLEIVCQLNILEKRDELYSFAHQAYQDYYHSQHLRESIS